MNLPQILERECAFINSLKGDWMEKDRLYQMLYRSISFDSPIYTALHGTTIVYKGKIILFGDGVNCIGKTSTALALAEAIVADEYSLYNSATGVVYGNKNLAISIRDGEKYGFKGSDGKLPEEIGLKVVTGKLDMIICPKPSDRDDLVEEKNVMIKIRKLAVTATAHQLKFKDSSLDRGNGKRDDASIRPELIDDIHGYSVPENLLALPYYDAYLTKPENIINLIKI